MSSVADKLIFNTLASREGVALPGVGALVHRRIPAKMQGSKTLFPPRNTVEFVPGSTEGVQLPDLLARNADNPDTARTLYSQWLTAHGLTQGGALPEKIEIEGVGEISGGQFTPSRGLGAVLNPLSVQPVRIVRRANPRRIAFVISVAAVLCVAATLLALSWLPGDFIVFAPAGQHTALPAATETIPTDTAAAAPADTLVTPPDTTASAPETAVTAQPATAAPAEPTAPGTKYHIVMGVYSTHENAEKYIRQNSPSPLQFTIVPMGSKFIVSGFCSGDQNEANAQKAKISQDNPGVWVYTQR